MQNICDTNSITVYKSFFMFFSEMLNFPALLQENLKQIKKFI